MKLFCWFGWHVWTQKFDAGRLVVSKCRVCAKFHYRYL